MKSKSNLFIAGAIAAGLALSAAAAPAHAQSVGYVTGIPGPDPAGGDELGWGPAYRPETSFYQPGTTARARSRRGAITSAPAARSIRRSAIMRPAPSLRATAMARRRGSSAALLITTATL